MIRFKVFVVLLGLLACLNTAFAQQRSVKRGVGWDESSHHISEPTISKLAPGVSWYYNWGQAPQGTASLLDAEDGVAYIPMCWNNGFSESALLGYLNGSRDLMANRPEHLRVLLGFNEPNFSSQSNMTPQQAATAWPRLEQIAEDYGLELVAPALNFSGEQVGGKVWGPYDWYNEFFRIYPEARVDYLALHCYMNWYSSNTWFATEYFYKDLYDSTKRDVYGKYPYLKQYLDNYKEAHGHFPKMFLTEFCAWENDGTITGVDFQIDQMTQKVQKLEQSELVAAYAWFMANAGNGASAYPYMSIFQTNNASSALSTLGQVYVHMSSFDTEKYYAPGEQIMAKDYVDASTDDIQVKVRPNSDMGSDIPLQIELQSGSWATYQVDLSEAATLTVVLRAKSSADNNVRVYYDEFKSTKKVFDGTVTSTINLWSDREVTTTKNIPAGQHDIIIYNGSTTSLFLNSMEIKQTTGIESLTPSPSRKGEGSIYDLSGRKVVTPKGIYIYNGKKYVVK